MDVALYGIRVRRCSRVRHRQLYRQAGHWSFGAKSLSFNLRCRLVSCLSISSDKPFQLFLLRLLCRLRKWTARLEREDDPLGWRWRSAKAQAVINHFSKLSICLYSEYIRTLLHQNSSFPKRFFGAQTFPKQRASNNIRVMISETPNSWDNVQIKQFFICKI